MSMARYGGVTGQTVVNSLFNTGIPGSPSSYISAHSSQISTYTSAQYIFPGLGVYLVSGSDNHIQLPTAQSAQITLAVPITNGSTTAITLNGVVLAVVTAVSTDTSVNLSQVAARIATGVNIASATANAAQNSISVTSTAGNPVVFNSAITNVNNNSVLTPYTWTVTSTTLTKFWGVSVYNSTKQNAYTPPASSGIISGTLLPYTPFEPVPVMQFGRILVAPETVNSAGVPTPITTASPVYVRTIATPQWPQVGTFRADADAGNAVLVPATSAQWMLGPGYTQGGVAELNITCVDAPA